MTRARGKGHAAIALKPLMVGNRSCQQGLDDLLSRSAQAKGLTIIVRNPGFVVNFRKIPSRFNLNEHRLDQQMKVRETVF